MSQRTFMKGFGKWWRGDYGPPAPEREVRAWGRNFVLAAALAGGTLLLAFASSLPKPYRWVGVTVLGTLGMAAILIGGLLGFLFAIPRFGTAIGGKNYVPNTNLEQVSDWLTKILVGLGLIQARHVADLFARLARDASRAVDGTTAHQTVIGGYVIFMVLPGFFVGYILARVALPTWFLAADISSPQTERIAPTRPTE